MDAPTRAPFDDFHSQRAVSEKLRSTSKYERNTPSTKKDSFFFLSFDCSSLAIFCFILRHYRCLQAWCRKTYGVFFFRVLYGRWLIQLKTPPTVSIPLFCFINLSPFSLDSGGAKKTRVCMSIFRTVFSQSFRFPFRGGARFRRRLHILAPENFFVFHGRWLIQLKPHRLFLLPSLSLFICLFKMFFPRAPADPTKNPTRCFSIPLFFFFLDSGGGGRDGVWEDHSASAVPSRGESYDTKHDLI